jgi:hypothetical protein
MNIMLSERRSKCCRYKQVIITEASKIGRLKFALTCLAHSSVVDVAQNGK